MRFNPNKTLIIGILGAATLVSTSAYISKSIEARELKKVISKPIANVTDNNEQAGEVYTDTAGRIHTVWRDRIITPEDLAGAVPENRGYIDSLAKSLNIKAGQLSESAQINGSLKGQVKAYQVTIDSLKRRTWRFEQAYLRATLTEADSMLDYSYDAKLNYSAYEKKNIYGRVTDRIIDISSPDSNFTVSGLKQFRIVEPIKPKTWGVGLQAGYYYDPSSGKFVKAIGIGISKNFIRF